MSIQARTPLTRLAHRMPRTTRSRAARRGTLHHGVRARLAQLLRPGGRLIGVVPDAARVLLRECPDIAVPASAGSRGAKDACDATTGSNSIGK
jgi:hypothetical protein